MALVTVLLLMAVFFVLALALLFQGSIERVVAVNEQDDLKALAHAEAGLAWARRRLADAPSFTDLLLGPDDADATDDHLPGLRDLSLAASSQFTTANEATASALVTRDLTGEGVRSWELIRLPDGPRTRAHVYLRLDDNHDEDPDDPTADDPLADTDNRVRVTVVAEYPVFVDGSGIELPANRIERPRGRRMLRATLSGGGGLGAISANADIDEASTALRLCGACGSVHANADLSLGGTASICRHATASGTLSASGTPTVGGYSASAYPALTLPVINPYDSRLVPRPEVFDAPGCPAPTAGDPGNAKYYALVAGTAGGKVYKAYRDFARQRWAWKLVSELAASLDEHMDDCGRAPGDAGWDPANAVDDGDVASFYGFRLATTEATAACTACGGAGEDASLCGTADNDFGVNGHYQYAPPTMDTLVPFVPGSGVPALPGGFVPSGPGDGVADFDAATRLSGGDWVYDGDDVWSPVDGAVLFVYGNVRVDGSPGAPIGGLCSSSGCVLPPPAGHWKVSVVAYGSVRVAGAPALVPARGEAGYPFLLVAGRDVLIEGNLNASLLPACGSGCSSSAPAGIETLAGVIAAHEQIRVSGDATHYGFLVAESAIDCSPTVGGLGRGASTFDGDLRVFYDCVHPPNPWARGEVRQEDWRELD